MRPKFCLQGDVECKVEGEEVVVRMLEWVVLEVEQFQKKLWKVRKTGIDVVVGVWVGSRREDYLVPVDQGFEGLGFGETLKSLRQMAGFNMDRKTATEMTQAFLSFGYSNKKEMESVIKLHESQRVGSLWQEWSSNGLEAKISSVEFWVHLKPVKENIISSCILLSCLVTKWRLILLRPTWTIACQAPSFRAFSRQ